MHNTISRIYSRIISDLIQDILSASFLCTAYAVVFLQSSIHVCIVFQLNTHILHYDTTMNRSGCLENYAHKIGDFGAFTESAV